MPFAGYDDFEACERANSDKRDPGAYCAAIKRATEQYDGDPDDVTVESLVDLSVTADELDALADESPNWQAHDTDAGRVWTDGAGAAVYQAGDGTEEQADGDFTADVFQIVQRGDDGPLSDGDLLGIGVDMPNAGVYVDWNIDAWPDDEQLEEPHVSDYGTIDDLENATGGSVEVIETVAPDGETLNQQSRVSGKSVLVNGLSDEARQSITEKYNVEIRDADE